MINQIHLGPIAFHLYGLIMAIAIYVGYILAKSRAHHIIPKKIFDDPILLLPLALAIIGARIYHVLDYWHLYKNNLQIIFYISRGGLGIWGALIGALIGFVIVAKVKKLSQLAVLDLVSPSIILGQALGRIGNFLNQEGFGPPTNKPWGIYIDPVNRPIQFTSSTHFHPTFFYEAALDLIFFVILIIAAKSLKVRGRVFSLYLILYSAGRFIIEFWRIDTATIDGIKIAQILATICFAIGLILFAKLKESRQS